MITGGGSSEFAFSQFLKSLKEFPSPTDELSTFAFAEALESIPIILSENFGLNPTEMLKKLQREHKNGHFQVGISSNDISNMFDSGVLEPMENKITQIKMATQTAIQILKINSVITHK
jgi:chaperonin GroEL (HSP60 family)